MRLCSDKNLPIDITHMCEARQAILNTEWDELTAATLL